MSYVAAILRQEGAKGVFYITGADDTGLAAWFYLRVPPLKRDTFRKLPLDEKLDLTEWGQVLKSGYGRHSTQKVRDEMQTLYGFKHQTTAAEG